MATVFIALGSNLGDCLVNLQTAHQHLTEIGIIGAQSSMIWTDPQYVTDQPRFLNQVLMLETSLLPLDLLKALKNIEKIMGREQTVRYGPRLIDLDILYYDREIINIEGLQIPHPEIANRDFVLKPMLEIAPDFVCPVSGERLAEFI